MVKDLSPTFTVYPVERRAGDPLGVVLPEEGTARFDPFLVFHEQGPVTYAPRRAVGFLNHPHRGFETVTYVIEGEQYHRDSHGREGVLSAGDVQWMTAGSGIFHSEVPTPELFERGGRVHAFQIWINLPSRLKMAPPRYQDVPSCMLPAIGGQGRWMRVIAGEAGGLRSPIETVLPTAIVHVRLEPGVEVEIDVPPAATTIAYAMKGGCKAAGTELASMHVAAARGLASPLLVGAGPAGFEGLILSSVPIGEPVCSAGPFVMNSPEEIARAFEDLEAGTFAMPPP